jgi:hypothetical protein
MPIVQRGVPGRPTRSARKRTRRRDESDLIILELVRITSTDRWSEKDAARALEAKGHSRGALHVAQARVLRVRAESPSRIAERAAATLSATLARCEQDVR